MQELPVLKCAVRCASLAQSLASLKPTPPDTDTSTDTDSDADTDQVGYNRRLEFLQQSTDGLESSLASYLTDAARNRRQNNASSVKELASNCLSLCGRVLAALQSGSGPNKRIATSLDTWKASRPPAGNPRRGFELRKSAERLQDLQSSLARQVGKVISNDLGAAKHRIRQAQLESRRFRCEKSQRLRALSNLIRDVEMKTRVLQQQESSSQTLSADDITRFESQLEEIKVLLQHIKKDHAVLRSLAFRSNAARYDAIPEAHQRTFSWVFSAPASSPVPVAGSSPSLCTWLEEGKGIFWVSGKPGAGKSTLIKFIADHDSTKEALARWSAPKRPVIVSHYFWCAGTQMQRSHSGLLQTLLCEILRQLPDDIESLLPERWSSSPGSTAWPMADLYQALYGIVARPDVPVKFCFFIDGLDEFEGDHLALCRELMRLARWDNAKLCLSSRPWSVFEEAFGSGEMGRLCLHDVTRDDIASYVLDQFAQQAATDDAMGQRDLRDLAAEISQRSQGVFLWVSLATRCLLEKLSQNESLSDILELLREYPPELDDFFTYNLNNTLEPDQSRMATSFLITDFAEKPLDIGIYYFHDMEFTDPEYVLSLSPNPPSRLEYRRQLSHTTQQLEAVCHGLLHVDPKTGVVNCLHRTVRDYLSLVETKTMLISKAPPGFSPSTCLLRASAAWTKTSRATMSEEPKAELVSSITSLLAAAAQLHTPDEVALCRRLLDHLDGCLEAKGPGAEASLQLLRSHAIGHRVWQYLAGVQSRRPQYFARLEVPALVVALFPDYEVGGEGREGRRPRWDAAATKTVSCLLDQGQDPNTLFSAAETLGAKTETTPWIVLCQHVLPRHDETHSASIRRLQAQLKMALETGILSEFLSHGADPNAKCARPGKDVSVAATDYLLHAFRLDADDDETLKTLYLDHIQYFAPKDAERLNAVIQDFSRLMDKARRPEQSTFLQKVSGKLLALASAQR